MCPEILGKDIIQTQYGTPDLPLQNLKSRRQTLLPLNKTRVINKQMASLHMLFLLFQIKEKKLSYTRNLYKHTLCYKPRVQYQGMNKQSFVNFHLFFQIFL